MRSLSGKLIGSWLRMLLFTPRLPSLATRDCENKSLFSVSSHPVKTKKDFFFSFLFFFKGDAG